MNDIDDLLSPAEEQQQQQQQSTYSDTATDALSLTMENLFEIHLLNASDRNSNATIIDFIPDLALPSVVYAIVFGSICALLCFLTIAGNLIVLSTFRRLRTVGNLFILSLATADLIVGCFVMPIAGIYAITEKWNMGLALCQIWISVDYTASTASIFNLLTLSLDRYWSITSPLQYLGKRTRTRALLLIGFAWGLSLLWVIPIFGWHLFNDGTRFIPAEKCEPEYTRSKVFKVSTAIINFYLPLLVLIGLNGRMYYEIKRRYKSVLLQRHSNKLNDSNSTTYNNHNNSVRHGKLNPPTNRPRSPVTITLCDSDRQVPSTTMNYTDSDSVAVAKASPKLLLSNNDSVLRINFKEKKCRSPSPSPYPEHQKSILKRTCSFVDQNSCTQDELTWFARHRNHCSSSFTQTPPANLSRYNYNSTSSRHQHLSEHSFKAISNSKSSSRSSEKQKMHRDSFSPSLMYKYQRYQTSFHHPTVTCRRCSFLDSHKISSTPSSTTTMNIFNLCHCCSTGTSAITIHSSHFWNHTQSHPTSSPDSYRQTRKASSSSSSSVVPSVVHRQQAQSLSQSPTVSLRKSKKAATAMLLPRSNSQAQPCQVSNKVKQATVWNQQEKAFRQLFAIVFGFTCCFLPYFILYMVVAFCDWCVSERSVTATVWLGYVNSTINPFLYALSNKHFRRTFNRLLKRDSRRQVYYN